MTKQIGFIPKENGEIEITAIEVKEKEPKPVQYSLLEWGKLKEWKGGKNNEARSE